MNHDPDEHLHPSSPRCCPPAPAPGDCPRCAGGVIELPAELYDPAAIPCPWCHPQAYPHGFAGVPVEPAWRYPGMWLIEPHPAAKHARSLQRP